MIRYKSQKQRTLPGFDTPPDMILNPDNRWVKLSECIPWDDLAQSYHKKLSSTLGRPAKDARIVIGAVIIKHKLSVSDNETVEQIRENPYLQYFIGLKGFQSEAPFAPSLFVEVRKRMGQTVFDEFHEAIVDVIEPGKARQIARTEDDDDDTDGDVAALNASGSVFRDNAETIEPSLSDKLPKNHGKLVVDASVVEQAIRFPTDLGLLNEARELSERIIDELHAPQQRPAEKEATHLSGDCQKSLPQRDQA